MITFVYYCFYLFVVCQAFRTESQENDFNNDDPDSSPKVNFFRKKIGADIVMECSNHFPSNENIIWQFKHCDNRVIKCDDRGILKLDYNKSQWQTLQFHENLELKEKRNKLIIRNATQGLAGLYRCVYDKSVLNVFMVVLEMTTFHIGARPEILSVAPSANLTTLHTGAPLVIHCRVKSMAYPTIRWFKVCFENQKCEGRERFAHDGYCYCQSNQSNYVKSLPNDSYVSKMNIPSTRETDTGTYVCVSISIFGEDHRNVSIFVQANSKSSFSLLFLIPLVFVLVPGIMWLVFYLRIKNNQKQGADHQKKLLKRNVEA